MNLIRLVQKSKPVIPAKAGIYNKLTKTRARRPIFLAFELGALWISACAEMTTAICWPTTLEMRRKKTVQPHQSVEPFF